MLSSIKLSLIFVVIILSIPLSTSAYQDGDFSKSGYYRFPAIYNSTIVFVAEGDLWKIGIEGGLAQRLTSHPDVESHPAISPDGKTVAFTARYEGPADVYVMPVSGGPPTRLTYNSSSSWVSGWTPDGRILYSTKSFSTLPSTQLAIIDPDNFRNDRVPLSQASQGAYSDDGETIYFTRFKKQWSKTKRYKGGTAENLWRFTDGDSEAIPLTVDFTGTSSDPMWFEDRVYFVSDRDGIMNIWSMDDNGQDLKQHTFNAEYDSKSPSLSKGNIVYQKGADLFIYNISDNSNRSVGITLASDFDHLRERWVKKPMDYLTAWHLSPDGEKIVLTARGQVFVAPAEPGRLVDAAHDEGIRYRNARFMPKGDSILALSDQSGEFEFCVFSIDGMGKPKQITDNGKTFRYDGYPSPDGMYIAYTDRNNKIWLYDIGGDSHTLIDSAEIWSTSGAYWSPDSRWIAYSKNVPSMFYQLFAYNIESEKSIKLTTDRYENYSPAWSADGKWLYFLSDRDFRVLIGSPWPSRQPTTALDKMTKIYMLPLLKGLISPFEPDHELTKQDEGDENEEKDGDEEDGDEEDKLTINIDTDGLLSRLMEVPVPTGSYNSLAVTDNQLFWISTGKGSNRELQTIEIKKKDAKVITLTKNVSGFELSLDGKKLLIKKGESFYVVKTTTSSLSDLSKNKVDLGSWAFSIDPRSEWKQMLVDAWRLERDYFYDPNMHDVEWTKVLEKYLPLVDRITDRDELSDLIGEMVGELSALHIYVSGGDFREGTDKIKSASLGALFGRDDKAGGYRVDYIYKTDPDEPHIKSPLAKPGVDIVEGDVITAINGISVLSVPHLETLLRRQAGNQVRLTVKSKESKEGRDVITQPISSSRSNNLRYLDWEYTRRMAVENQSNNEIGYVHLRAMRGSDYSDWARDFFASLHKKGLIIDVRHNSGGSIDSWILTSLIRKPYVYWKSRTGLVYPNMQSSFNGHVVVLCNEWTASDGELFCQGIRSLNIGKVIGKRTWGGEVWLSYNNYLVDKGIASACQSGVFAPDGDWVIEGHGFEPDIVVDNLPHATFNGEDAQLDAAIRYLKEQIGLHPVELPAHPEYPDKSNK